MSNKIGFMTGLIIGGLTGAAIALLNAPRSGEETRKEIQTKATDIRRQTETRLNRLQEQADAVINDVSTEAQHLIDQTESKMNEYRLRAGGVMKAAREGAKDVQKELA